MCFGVKLILKREIIVLRKDKTPLKTRVTGSVLRCKKAKWHKKRRTNWQQFCTPFFFIYQGFEGPPPCDLTYELTDTVACGKDLCTVPIHVPKLVSIVMPNNESKGG